MRPRDSDKDRSAPAPSELERIRQLRAHQPSAIAAAYSARVRRELIGKDGRLFIVAADHPARGALSVRTDSMAMASRSELLQRLVLAISRPGVDGVLGTPDILDDLALLGALDGKVAVGSMNRGGLRGAVFEMDDRFTGYDVDSIRAARLDMAKLLVRFNLSDAGTANTMEAAARAITAAAKAKIPIMLEPFMSDWVDGRIENNLTTDGVIASITIASGLGADSAYTWLKLPVVPQMERVLDATTLPAVLLGGDAETDPDETFASWESALALPGVFGLVVGRTLLYPRDGDVATAVDTAASLVHSRTPGGP